MSHVYGPERAAGAAAADFEALLERGASVTLLLACGWLALLVLAGFVEASTAGRVRALAGVGCPQSWRPVVLLLLGAVLASPVGAAHAAKTGAAPAGADRDGNWLPLPTRPVDRPDRVDRHVVVQHDTLWDIARQQLGGSAADATVLSHVARLHHTNRLLIGDEPDLILPGQRLVLPPLPPEGARR